MLLCVDQFEQLAELPESSKRRFARLLADAINHHGVVVGTLRVEFLAAVSSDPSFGIIPFQRAWIGPLATSDLRSVIVEPARIAGLTFDDGLVDRMVGDAVDGEALPLLAFTLHEMAKEKARGQTLTLDRYEELDGVRGAVAAQARRALAQATRATNLTDEAVAEKLLALVDIDAGGRSTRRIVDLADTDPQSRLIFAEFVQCRLLSKHSRDDGSALSVSVSHEILFEAWEPLRDAIDRRRAQLRIRTEIQQGAVEWARNGRDHRYLWQADRLSLVHQEKGPRRQIEVNGIAGEFYRRSLRRVRSRRRALLAVLSTLLLVVTAFGIRERAANKAETRSRNVAEVAKKVADDRATSLAVQSLLDRSDSLRNSDPVLALRLALAAQKIRPGVAATSRLLDTLMTSRLTETVVPASQNLSLGAWSPDGARYVDIARSSLHLWQVADRRSARQGAALPSDDGQTVAPVWSPDGRMLAVDGLGEFSLYSIAELASPELLAGPIDVSEDGSSVTMDWQPHGHLFAVAALVDSTVTLWNVTSPRHPVKVRRFPVPGGGVAFLRWAPNGRTLAVGDYDGNVRLWSATGRAVPVPIGPRLRVRNNSPVRSITWSPDGKGLAAVTEEPAIRVWDVADPIHPRESPPLNIGRNVYLDTVAWSPDGSELAAMADSQVLVWNVQNLRRPAALPSPSAGLNRNISAISWAGRGHLLTTVVGGAMLRWDLNDKVTRLQVGTPSTDVAKQVDSLAWSPIAPVLATVTDAGSVQLLTGRGQSLAHFHIAGTKLSDTGCSIGWSPDGRMLVVTTADNAYFYNVSDIRRPYRVAKNFHEPSITISAVKWVANRPVMSINGPTSADFFDTSDPLAPRRAGSVPDYFVLAWTLDGMSAILSDGDHDIVVFDLRDPAKPKKTHTWHFTPRPNDIRPAPRGHLMVAMGQSTSLFDMSDLAHPRALGNPLIGESDPVTDAAWSPDGGFLLLSTDSGMVSVRDVADPASPFVVFGPVAASGIVTGASPEADAAPPYDAWSGDGRTFATASLGRVLLWQVDGLLAVRKNAVARACDASAGGLSKADWITYVQIPYQGPSCP